MAWSLRTLKVLSMKHGKKMDIFFGLTHLMLRNSQKAGRVDSY